MNDTIATVLSRAIVDADLALVNLENRRVQLTTELVALNAQSAVATTTRDELVAALGTYEIDLGGAGTGDGAPPEGEGAE